LLELVHNLTDYSVNLSVFSRRHLPLVSTHLYSAHLLWHVLKHIRQRPCTSPPSEVFNSRRLQMMDRFSSFFPLDYLNVFAF
uniref:Ovule protein n=1 Tax=Mesocestoides corti TaxID=53468 RepID=A0A5K3EQF4_MESCO